MNNKKIMDIFYRDIPDTVRCPCGAYSVSKGHIDWLKKIYDEHNLKTIVLDTGHGCVIRIYTETEGGE